MAKKTRKQARLKRRAAPKENIVRPEIMAHVRRSVDANRKLLRLLAK
jgi:hypothetical protein